ncbi:hypothetical protein SARC_00235 [Sphaeroforma arctica JP610]|uniref:TNFR-Cys domain-containing protein n=1 Tax=Sphaeroforma arctica JP610 TaxID=667725 RepID=A0A0L0GFP5_9EUKA|nr:hypothetical protein SARC_00235 [Sphaeroforma arctica JP610]KNC87664.1 hypothetical protein SARC_00235 [Sphaeroforma arctica JP610]|eukprot:XP_014161566.1 hypothetical protein SARC_00235 [Sphaeroforma arctica JP610]
MLLSRSLKFFMGLCMLALLVAPIQQVEALPGFCRYCDYCSFCTECKECPCDHTDTCKMCKYCKFCTLCTTCDYVCVEGGVVDRVSSWFSHFTSPEEINVDDESLEKELKQLGVSKPKRSIKM